MTHEFKHILNKAVGYQKNGVKSVLASVVHLEGSSYRKPCVRMLITEDGKMTGAVSGGCIEREIYHQSSSVFKSGIPKIMTYDGRYRLGCEGLLYILIEPFFITDQVLNTFLGCLENRNSFIIRSYFKTEDVSAENLGSVIEFKDDLRFSFRDSLSVDNDVNLKEFVQKLEPCFKLLIFGGEHDAVKLCSMASLLGWEVDIITSAKDPKSLVDFPGATSVTPQTPDILDLKIDSETAVVLMNHNYVQDLKYLIKLESYKPNYIGILGSAHRREKLISDVYDHVPNFDDSILERIYSPAGLNIGAITPEEIALSIMSEILSVYRGIKPKSLREVSKQHVSK
jgi:xanthine/CO dehydrogenase XdhC/CoxF family maturation factor